MIIPYIFHLCHLGQVGIPCHRSIAPHGISSAMEGQAIPCRYQPSPAEMCNLQDSPMGSEPEVREY